MTLILLLSLVHAGDVGLEVVVEGIFRRQAEFIFAYRDATYLGSYVYREYDHNGNLARTETCTRRVYVKGYGQQHIEFLDVAVNGQIQQGGGRERQIRMLKMKGLVQDEASMPFRLETRRDYAYELLGEDSMLGRPAWVVGFEPGKKSMQTVIGRGWLDKETYDLLGLEFRPAWVPWVCKGTCMRLHFERFDDIYLPVFFEMDMELRVKFVVTLLSRRLRIEDRYTDYEFNLGLPDSLFD